MSTHHGEAFFEALFGFREIDYLSTRQHLFRLCTTEAQRRCTLAGTQQVYKERAVFSHPRLGKAHHVSSGWHSTPSVAELRAETADLVRIFKRQHPGLLAAIGSDQHVKNGTPADPPPSSDAPVRSPSVRCSHTIGESGALHRRFPHAFFQVASQFNSLEFISASVTPEDGVTHYVYDHTQGPACALACMAGTAYRNFLLHPDLFDRDGAVARDPVVVAGEAERGQQADHQLNLLDDFTHYLTSAHGSDDAATTLPAVRADFFYRIVNGYFVPAATMSAFVPRVEALAKRYDVPRAEAEEALVSRLRVALVEDATVTLPLHDSGCKAEKINGGDSLAHCDVHTVSQSYNSAVSLPSRSSAGWSTEEERAGMEALARLVLLGTYEATLLAGVQHTLRSLEQQTSAALPPSSPLTLPPIFLTKVGGGVFNNDAAWIAAAIDSAVCRVGALGVPLDVRLVHYRAVERFYAERFPAWPTETSM